MSPLRPFVTRLWRNTRGAMVIETALVLPALAILSLGGFEVGSMVSRQAELQSAAAEASAIAIASTPDTEGKRNTLKQVIMASTGLTTSHVTLTQKYRCGSSTSYVSTSTGCGSGVKVSSYLLLQLTDRYTPVWTSFGVGSPLDYSVSRYVMLNQQ